MKGKKPKAAFPHPQKPHCQRRKATAMAKLLLPVIVFLLFATMITANAAARETDRLLQSQNPSPRPPRIEKLSHLRFFFHDILTGRTPSAVTVARAASTNTSSTFFGMVNVIDDPLTEGPSMASKLVGRAQGMYASAAQDTVGLLMAMNFAFTEGKYNGSTIAILGRNQVFNDVREMPVIGGSGRFRLARGYVQARTHNLDMKTGNAVVEYNCYVYHY